MWDEYFCVVLGFDVIKAELSKMIAEEDAKAKATQKPPASTTASRPPPVRRPPVAPRRR